MKSLRSMTGVVIGGAGALLLAGCGPHTPAAPTGQVVATVDGTEITDAMIDAEGRPRQLPPQVMTSAPIRKSLLADVISRALLAEQTRKDKLDQTPEALADFERLHQDFLARLTLTKQVSRPDPVSDAAAQTYIAAHPETFGDRTVLKVDQIRYWSAGDAIGNGYLKDAHILEEVEQQLALTRKPFERKTVQLDSAVEGKALIDRIAATPSDQLYHFDANGMTIVGTVLEKTSARIPPEQALLVAKDRIQRAQVNGEITAYLDRLKKGAKILYRKQGD